MSADETLVTEGDQQITLAGESLLLTAVRGIVWPSEHALIIADLHIGKAAAFRALGLPMPRGTTNETLARLTTAIERYAIERIYMLGDFLHARQSLQQATLGALYAWREQHAAIEIVLVSGNHDRHAGPPPRDLNIDVRAEFSAGPFRLAHYPKPSANGYVLAGHLHPAIRVSSRWDSVRLPCYWLRDRVGVLPSFGAFTGAYEITPEPGDRVYALADERVVVVPN